MGVIHGLEGDAGVIAVKVTVLNEVLDGVDNLKVERYPSQHGGMPGKGRLAHGTH